MWGWGSGLVHLALRYAVPPPDCCCAQPCPALAGFYPALPCPAGAGYHLFAGREVARALAKVAVDEEECSDK